MAEQETYPSVTVVIATADRPGLLERAVTRIFEQDYLGHVQCVVVYDHVPVRQLDVETPPRRELTLVGNTHAKGLPGGRNTGCDVATGELLAFCDDDDIWLPQKLRRQVEFMREHPEFGAVACGISLVGPGIHRDRPGRTKPVTLDDLLDDRVLEVHPSTMVVTRETVDAAGPVDEEIPGGYAEDYEWLLRVAKLGPIGVVPDPMVVVEWHGGSFFFGKWMMIADALRYLLAKHPEFSRSRVGKARIHGQIAFALASAGHRREALAEMRTAARLNPKEKRLVATMPVVLGLMSGNRILRMAQKQGRGV